MYRLYFGALNRHGDISRDAELVGNKGDIFEILHELINAWDNQNVKQNRRFLRIYTRGGLFVADYVWPFLKNHRDILTNGPIDDQPTIETIEEDEHE